MKWYSIDTLRRAAVCLLALAAGPHRLSAHGDLTAAVTGPECSHEAPVCVQETSECFQTASECFEATPEAFQAAFDCFQTASDCFQPADTLTTDTAAVQYVYERRRQRAVRSWARLIPTQAVAQYAGSIGIVSVGLGWHYGRGLHWETELLAGLVPRYHSGAAHFSFTVKERYVPWHCRLSSRWSLEPLTAGFFFNTISGEDFWRREPSRYPKRYYGFSTKVRTHIYLGQRVKYHIPRRRRVFHQSVAAYYELSTCDLYLVSKCTNREYPWRKTLSLALGLVWDM